MADQDFNFDEFLSEPQEQTDTKKTSATKTTRTTRTTNHTLDTINSDDTEVLHPFSARLDKDYIEKIKAIAWRKRISQRELIENALDQYLDNISSEELKDIINKYNKIV